MVFVAVAVSVAPSREYGRSAADKETILRVDSSLVAIERTTTYDGTTQLVVRRM